MEGQAKPGHPYYFIIHFPVKTYAGEGVNAFKAKGQES
jgi:hypothetical protein